MSGYWMPNLAERGHRSRHQASDNRNATATSQTIAP
jgi:hypothetical protein